MMIRHCRLSDIDVVPTGQGSRSACTQLTNSSFIVN